jgi:nicotinate-nucleotide adenylyltransferase
MRIGVFGGSFDPVHLGHLRLAECCWREARLDRVEFIPAARQPHKPHGPIAPAADRVAMLKLALEDRPEFGIETIEVDRGGVSYTIDTLRAMSASQPQAELFFLMGADSLADFPNWREPEGICRMALPLVVRRAGAAEPDFDALRPFVSASRLEEIRNSEIEMPATPISSSEIRRLIAKGGEWRRIVPEKVADYIAERGLYQ